MGFSVVLTGLYLAIFYWCEAYFGANLTAHLSEKLNTCYCFVLYYE